MCELVWIHACRHTHTPCLCQLAACVLYARERVHRVVHKIPARRLELPTVHVKEFLAGHNYTLPQNDLKSKWWILNIQNIFHQVTFSSKYASSSSVIKGQYPYGGSEDCRANQRPTPWDKASTKDLNFSGHFLALVKEQNYYDDQHHNIQIMLNSDDIWIRWFH